MVYNKTFKDNNFNSSNSIKGVFTLGEATEDDMNLIEEKKEQLKIIKDQGSGYKSSLIDLEGNEEIKGKLPELNEEFKEYCWKKIYKEYEPHFKEAFKGSMQKQSFQDKILLEFKSNEKDLLDIEKLKEKAKTIFGETPEKLTIIQNIELQELLEIEENELLSKKIIGKEDINISKLIHRLNINDWVNQGKEYIQDNNICPFCQNETITDEFRKQLEEYFNTTFIESIEKIRKLQEKYESLSENIVNQLNHIEQEQKLNKNSKLNIEMLVIFLKTLNTQFTSNKNILSNKVKEPSRSLELSSTKEQLEKIKALILEANIEIDKHNKIVDNYQNEKSLLISSIWKFIVESFRDDIDQYIYKYKGLSNGIKKLTKQHKENQNEWKELNNEIKELGKNVTSVQPTIDKINDTLRYYGFLNFEIVPSETDKNQYQIKREDGTLAQDTLSEGEITFITFLYFYELSKGATNEEEVSNDRVLVIDDPVSSLDSNVLFVVSTLIKDIIDNTREGRGNIKQLILLTHNVYFHKEVSFINSRDTNGRNDTFFWILRKNNKVSSFKNYEKKNPIQTSYQLLWQEIKERNSNSILTIQNTMRKIIENYFKILGNYKDENLIQKFESYEQQLICKSLISWVNDGSHSVSDDLFIEVQDDSIEYYLEVFKNIFIFTNHEGHYNMMMGIEGE
jgi:wobble nucleotide-excising tRNase